MKIKKWLGSSFRKRGIALVLVVGALALMVVLLLAMFSVTQTEFSATQGHVAAQSAKQFADVASAIVQAQIQNGQNTIKSANRTIHATQPGAVRVYDKSGFLAGYRLYSSSKMAETTTGITGEKKFVTDSAPPTDWDSDTNKARYVDLNEPVVRAPLSGTVPAVYFPIIDPRAAFNDFGSQTPASGDATSQVEGFSYTKAINGVVTPADSSADASLLRLPMPVEWMYVLQDGTFGTLDANNKFVSATSGVVPTTANPIVSRIAFWTDDESCKVNINTAAEPTFMDSPFYFHDRDRKWAHFPPAAGEYQRYPGHPATVALSSVLLPNLKLDPVKPDAGLTVFDVRDIKEQIYDFAPKIVRGGSKSGTLPFVSDDFDGSRPEDPATPAGTASSAISISASKEERLYATVDEMLFKDGGILGNPRTASRYPSMGSNPNTLPNGRVLFDHDALERSRFFLTANSRAPEFSIHGLPRICIWPVADETQAVNKPAPDQLRTDLDKIIALCATNRRATSETSTSVKNSYFFRRSQAHHPTQDVTGAASGQNASPGLARNSQLLEYIVTQLSQLNYPQSGSSAGSSANFVDKYGTDNVNQLAIEIFDYVRCTNLYDGILASMEGFEAGTGATIYDQRDSVAANCRTFTNQRKDSNTPYPGHGQVTPAKWTQNGKDYSGFGRTFTISELGFKVVCTADGLNDQYAVDFNGTKSGGGTAPRYNPSVANSGPMTNSAAYPNKTLPAGTTARWYSNFPPLLYDPSNLATTAPTQAQMKYGTSITTARALGNFHPANHPGYDPANWNLSLAEDTPLLQTEKRIQVLLMLETFCPSMGFTSLYPEYSIVLDHNYIAQIKIIDSTGTPVALFNTVQDFPMISNANIQDDNPGGGHVNPSKIIGAAYARGVNGEASPTGKVSLPVDTGYTPGGPNSFEFTSNFVTVLRAQPLQFIFPTTDFVITIYDSKTNRTPEHLVQTININIANPPVMPVPDLVGTAEDILKGGLSSGFDFAEWTDNPLPTDGSNPNHYRRSVQPPHHWVFNRDGIIGRKTGTINPLYTTASRTSPSLAAGQKLWTTGKQPVFSDATGELGNSLRGRLSDGRAVSSSAILRVTNPPEQAEAINTDVTASDVVRTMVPKVGDYRMVAARSVVPSSMWALHPAWKSLNVLPSVETWSGVNANSEAGKSILPAASYFDTDVSVKLGGRFPDLPTDGTSSDLWLKASRSFGDFDVAVSDGREGPYINKPDEGTFNAANRAVINSDGTSYTTKFYRGANFYRAPSAPIQSTSDAIGANASGNHMTPNRLISSPVLFGSLPTGVWPGGAAANTTSALANGGLGSGYADSNPWQTLLFRPYVPSSSDATSTHPGSLNPRDHYLLDLFFMPVVEPYAISEPLSEAGKINLNYQILPFTNIRRATGLHALLKGEFMTAIPNTDAVNAKSRTGYTPKGEDTTWDSFWKDDSSTYGNKFWHRPIDIVETLRQFDERFSNTGNANENGLFKSASQICEVHLVPDVSGGVGDGEGSETSSGMRSMDASTRAHNMENFWKKHSPTGDNIRERPYSNIYSRVTTRSNTFRVHVRAQVIKKARSTDPATFDPDKDAILSEYRGSTVLERYIDPNDTEHPLPDYATVSDPLAEEPLDTFYKFRTLETKRFNP